MTDGDRPPRPDPLNVDPDTVPDDLRDRERWVCWRYEFDDDRDEWTKIPIDAESGGYASATDPDTWTSFGAAVAYHDRDDRDTDGLGYVVGDGDTVLGLDFDDCRDPDSGELEAWAANAVDRVDTYAEVSPSGTGLRLFGHGFVPDGGNRADVDDAAGHLELYDDARYLTITGHRLDDAPESVEVVNDAVADLHTEYVADDADTAENRGVDTRTDGTNPGVDAGKPGSGDGDTPGADLSDDELVAKATDAENGEKFARLWDGRTDGYPSHSEADLALASLLAWWTGGDRERTERLFRDSGLYREKWDRDDYRERTLDMALESVTDGYDPAAADGGTGTDDGPNVPPPEQLIAEIEAGERSYGGDDGDGADGGPDTEPWLSPASLVAYAGLSVGEDDTTAGVIGDLSDREAAAYVWELAKRSEDVHVRVRRENGGLWAFDPDTGTWDDDGERALRHAARRTLSSVNYGENVLRELKAQARADPDAEVPADAFGVDTGTVAVANGLLDLDAAADGAGMDALRELRPDDYALARLPVEYDPDATATEWARYVDEWAEDGKADALQEYVGYCLHVGAIPIHRALLLVGSGANGKGTFLHVVRALLGPENTTSIELQTLANERDAVADFYGALANIDDDLSARKLGAGTGMFKKLVGGDRVRGRRLYEDAFEFDATGKHLYAANEVPDVNVPAEDEAFWRRWLLVEFPNHYPPTERDPELRDRLTDPDRLSGVLNWAIAGRARLLDQGHFTNERRYGDAKRERWQAWGDSVDSFISECLKRDPDTDNISTGDVHRVYAAWCRENGEKPVGQQKLTLKLKKEDFDYAKRVRPAGTGTPTRGFKALGFNDAAPDLEDTSERGDPDGGQQESLF